jgi:uncharacterized membrane protein
MKKTIIITFALLLFSFSLSLFAQQKYFSCRGNEPFWNMTIKSENTTYKQIDGTDLSMPTVQPLTARGHIRDYILVYKTKLKKNDEKVTLVLTRNHQGCSDGMSDKKSPYNVVVIFQDKVMAGCCDPA